MHFADAVRVEDIHRNDGVPLQFYVVVTSGSLSGENVLSDSAIGNACLDLEFLCFIMLGASNESLTNMFFGEVFRSITFSFCFYLYTYCFNNSCMHIGT